MRFKYISCILLIFIVNSLHVIFFENNDKYDVYVFYDHSRYLTNILYDVSVLFQFIIFTYLLQDLKRNIFKPLFIVGLLSVPSYFLFYHQISSLFVIPIYLILTIYYNRNKFATK